MARLLGACLAAAAVWACGPVYIPVPPPNQTTFTAEIVTDAAGVERTFWITAGGVDDNAANARYFIVDRERAAGVIATGRDDGSYQAPPMEGSVGDHVVIYYEDTRGRRSPVTCVLLSELRPRAERCP